MKKKIDILEHINHILKELNKGILITVKCDDKVNPMSISWGTFGIEWNRNVFVIFVRENRYTRSMLDKNPEFTVNIPINKIDRNIIKVCGMQSGYNIDKIKELNLTLEEPNMISVPGIKELPLTLECKILYKKKQDYNELPENIKNTFYPQDVDSSFYGSNKDCHIAYYAEIVDCYIIE
ncbi:flavin reductase family protein [Brachyspira alvinipulli]|uniref:flavin reductase n=1 Tax=Brachyspira alvinipulli TaxID=84379 RepID=UPI003006FC67